MKSKEVIKYIYIGAGILFLIGIVMTVVLSVEVLEAREFCNSIEGDYQFKIESHPHYCNDKPIYNYRIKGFDFEQQMSISIGNID